MIEVPSDLTTESLQYKALRKILKEQEFIHILMRLTSACGYNSLEDAFKIFQKIHKNIFETH